MKSSTTMRPLRRDASTSRRRLFLLVAWLLVLAPSAVSWAAPDRPPQLVDYYDNWLVSVESLIEGEDQRFFLSLSSDTERELFIHHFWRARERTDGTNPLLERWRRHFDITRRRFVDLSSARAQALMRTGSPARVLAFGGCGGPVRPMEVWVFNAAQANYLTRQQQTESFHLVFVAPSARQAGTYHSWSPSEDLSSLVTSIPGRQQPTTIDQLFNRAMVRPCGATTMSEMRAIRTALHEAWSFDELDRRLGQTPSRLGWLDELRGLLTTQAALPARPVEFSQIGHFNRYVVVRGQIHIPATEIQRNADGMLFDRLVIVGDIWQAKRFNGPFSIVHHLAGPKPEGSVVTLDFYRRLRPGTYQLDLRVENGDGLALLREGRELRVEWVEQEAVPPAGYRKGFAGLLRSEVGLLTTFPSVRILVTGDELLAGEVEIEAVTTGGPIARLDFFLGDEIVGSDEQPPYSVTLELGADPRPQALEARAFDPAGLEMARDQIDLNVGSPRFDVRLLEPRREQPSSRVKVAIDVPLEEELDRLELYLDDERFATLREPPFVRALPDHIGQGTVYIRAVAWLKSGEQAEDLVVIDRRPVERIDVELVELFTSVSDARGRPVNGLRAEDFRVLEDGEEQKLERFDRVENLPIHVSLLMDVSQSMRDRIGIATLSAQRFFEKVLTPKDQASFLTFNHDIRLIVPFTNDIRRLHHGASGLRGWGSTRLNDSLIYSLHYFGGREGRKALVLLSDGHDVDSDFYFEQVLEHALRSGVTAYPIGLALDHDETRSALLQLAGATGGRFFTIASASELDRVYRLIEQDLRSQYLLVYRPAEKSRTQFRQVEVEVLREGLKARTIHGYYP